MRSNPAHQLFFFLRSLDRFEVLISVIICEFYMDRRKNCKKLFTNWLIQVIKQPLSFEKVQKNSLTFPLFCCSRISMEEKVALWLVRPGRVRLLGRPGRYESRYILAISLIFEGTSCFVSVRSVISSSAIFAFFSLKNAVAQPVLPARPVRPIRCTYSSISDGRSKLIR